MHGFPLAIRMVAAAALAGLALTSEAVCAEQTSQKEKNAPAAVNPDAVPAPLSGLDDSGTFSLYKDEERLVTITFTLKADGAFDNQSVLTFAGQSVKRSVKITPDKEGRWASITTTSPQGDVSLVREGGVARQTTKGKTVTINLKPNAMLFENFSPALMSQAIRAYDKKKAGKQEFPLFLLPVC
jgi:hypothetical protein